MFISIRYLKIHSEQDTACYIQVPYKWQWISDSCTKTKLGTCGHCPIQLLKTSWHMRLLINHILHRRSLFLKLCLRKSGTSIGWVKLSTVWAKFSYKRSLLLLSSLYHEVQEVATASKNPYVYLLFAKLVLHALH